MNSKIGVIIVAATLVASAAGIYFFFLKDGDGSKPIDVDLEIFGNADKDWKIDENDALIIESYINAVSEEDEERIAEIEKNMSLRFADANNDGKIDQEDVVQIRAIANGTAEHLWFLDGIQEERDIDLDIKRIGTEYFTNTEMMLILEQKSKIVAVDYAPFMCKDFYFPGRQLENMANMDNPDYDLMNGLELDVLLVFAPSASAKYEEKQKKIIGCDVLYLGLYVPDLTNTSKSNFIQGILKAGYIFGNVERAEDYTNWVLEKRDKLLELANSIPNENKPVVGMSNYTSTQYFMNESIKTLSLYKSGDPLGQAVILAGGINILGVIGGDGDNSGSVSVQVDAVFNDDSNVHVDYFFLHLVKYTYSGMVNAGVPDHGYAVNNNEEMKNACNNASSRTLLSDEVITLIAGDFRNGCTGGILLAAYIGSIINPNVYSEIDPVEMHNDYVKWMGIENYDVNTKGVFVYTSN